MPQMIVRCLPLVRSLVPKRVLSRIQARQVSTTASILPDDIYDLVVVGGGIAGLSLATSLRTNPPQYPNQVSTDIAKDLKVALVERNSLKSSILKGPPANRCSSLTPSSIQFLKGQSSEIINGRHWRVETHPGR